MARRSFEHLTAAALMALGLVLACPTGGSAQDAWLAESVPASPGALFDIGSFASINIAATQASNGNYYVSDLGTAPSGTFRRIRNAGSYTISFVMDGMHIIGYAPASPIPATGTSDVLPVAPTELVEFVSLGSDSWQLVQYMPLGIMNFGLQNPQCGGCGPTTVPPDNWFQLGPGAGTGPEPDFPFAVNWTLHGGKIHTHGLQIMLPGDSPPIDFMNADQGSRTTSFTGSISGTTLTVSAILSDGVTLGGTISGAGITPLTTVVSQLTGAPSGVGTYNVSASQSVSSTTISETLGPNDQSPIPWSTLYDALSFAGHVGGRNLVNIAQSGPPVYEFPNSSQPSSPAYPGQPGCSTGCGPSYLYQARNAQINFVMTEIPTATNGGGAVELDVARNGTVTGFMRAWLAENGNLVELGKGAIEACGITYPYNWTPGPNLHPAQARAPCNDAFFAPPSVTYPDGYEGVANFTAIATDYTNSSLDSNNAAFAMRQFGHHGEGLDLGMASTDTADFLAVHSNTRTVVEHVDLPTSQITYPKKSAFQADLTANLNNVTGDGTSYPVVFNTLSFDQDGNYNTSTGIFTAPVAGIYQLEVTLDLSGVTTSNNRFAMNIVTTSHNYLYDAGKLQPDVNSRVALHFSVLEKMNAGDIAKIIIEVDGGSKGVSVLYGGSGIPMSNFSGFLVG